MFEYDLTVIVSDRVAVSLPPRDSAQQQGMNIHPIKVSYISRYLNVFKCMCHTTKVTLIVLPKYT